MRHYRLSLIACATAAVLGGLGFVTWHPASSTAESHLAAVSPAAPKNEWRAGLPRGHSPSSTAPTPAPSAPDPLTLLPALATQPAGRERTDAVATLVTEIGRTDSASALDLALALPGADDGTLEHRLQLWTETAPAEAIAWVKAQPAGATRDRLLARAAYVRVQSNPAEALELLQLMSAEPANDAPTRAVLKLWQQRDPAGADRWLAQNLKT